MSDSYSLPPCAQYPSLTVDDYLYLSDLRIIPSRGIELVDGVLWDDGQPLHVWKEQAQAMQDALIARNAASLAGSAPEARTGKHETD